MAERLVSIGGGRQSLGRRSQVSRGASPNTDSCESFPLGETRIISKLRLFRSCIKLLMVIRCSAGWIQDQHHPNISCNVLPLLDGSSRLASVPGARVVHHALWAGRFLNAEPEPACLWFGRRNRRAGPALHRRTSQLRRGGDRGMGRSVSGEHFEV